MKGTLLALLVFTFFSQSVLADILFVDLNNSFKEVEAAKRAAEKRGEKLIVLPAIPAETQKKIQSIENNLRTIENKMEKLGCADTNSKDCEKLYDEGTELGEKKRAFFKSYRLTGKELGQALKSIENKKSQLSSVVFSGHDGNGMFMGELGGFKEAEIAKAFSQVPQLKKGVRSVMLWGCYTANMGALNHWWKKSFPDAEVIAGFDGVAPSGLREGSSNYLEDVLVKEKEMTAIKDEKVLAAFFKKIKDVRSMNAALCSNNIYVSNSMSFSLGQTDASCEGVDLGPVKEIYSCYKNAETEKCANPPSDYSRGELRQIYNTLQSYRHCFEGKEAADLPDPENVIRLLFFNNVKKHFSNEYVASLEDLDKELENLKVPKDLRFSRKYSSQTIAEMSRAELIRRINGVRDFLSTKNSFVNRVLSPSLGSSLKGLESLQTCLGEVSPSCIPFGWVEPEQHERPIRDLF